MSRYCVDTSAYSYFRRGDRQVVEILDSADWLGVPSIVLGELETGFLLGSRLQENRDRLQEFLDHPLVEILGVDRRTSQIYAEMVVDLRRAGSPLPVNDIWIAAIGARFAVPVLTYDEHFKRIARVDSLVLRDPRNSVKSR